LIDPGSFRDPNARVFTKGNRILRGLSKRAAETFALAEERGLMGGLVDRGLMVECRPVKGVTAPAGVPDALILEARRLPFVTYPYEWSFEMLKDAALATLDVTAECFEAGFGIKDATAYNMTFDGCRPVLIDVTSIDADGPEMWVGYGQFCDHFLAPLLLEAYKGIAFQPYLRGHLEGIPIVDLAPMFRGFGRFRRGVPMHVLLRRRIERRARNLDTAGRVEVRSRARLPKAAILRNIRKMRSLVERLRPASSSVWSKYESELHGADYAAAKESFVRRAAAQSRRKGLAWDVGANAGRHAVALLDAFPTVVALDGDSGAVDRMYRAFRGTAEGERIVPMVVDIADPSVNRGWRGAERRGLLERGKPDFALWLAIAHHICLGRGVPLSEFVALVAEVSAEAVVEFVDADDPMSRRLLATRTETHEGYDLDSFRSLLAGRFAIVTEEPLSSTRRLFHVRAS
jgi:hypothetical protein